MGPKKSSSSNSEESLHEAIISQLSKSAGNKGITDDDVAKVLPGLSKENRVQLINKLIGKGQLDLLLTSDGTVIYKCSDAPKSNQVEPCLKGAENEEKIVYGIIKEADNKGIWIRDIRFKCNLLPTLLTKVLKSLENKKLIKAVKSISAHKKKVYMLYNLEPDSTLTGGSWYSGEDFESEFVDILNQQCYRYLVDKKESNQQLIGKKGPLASLLAASASPEEVCNYISELKISNVDLSEEDIKTILDTLLYDGKVERKFTQGGYIYRAVDPLLPPRGFACIPCSICPVIRRCNENSTVNSVSCPYLSDWSSKNSAIEEH